MSEHMHPLLQGHLQCTSGHAVQCRMTLNCNHSPIVRGCVERSAWRRVGRYAAKLGRRAIWAVALYPTDYSAIIGLQCIS
jgi:hypothetical protein